MKICNKKAVEFTPEQEKYAFNHTLTALRRLYSDFIPIIIYAAIIIALCGQSENMRRKRRNRQSCHILQTTKMLR